MKHYSKLKERKISSQTLFKGIVGVKFDTVKLINGNTATRLYLDHKGASAVLAVDQGMVYLVQQYRYAIGQTTWEIPAGKREKGQSFAQCARAELKQETGMTARNLREVLMFHPSNAFSSEELHLFVATGLQYGETSPDQDEFINVRKFSFDAAYQLIEKGQIHDAKTIIMLQWWKLHHLDSLYKR